MTTGFGVKEGIKDLQESLCVWPLGRVLLNLVLWRLWGEGASQSRDTKPYVEPCMYVHTLNPMSCLSINIKKAIPHIHKLYGFPEEPVPRFTQHETRFLRSRVSVRESVCRKVGHTVLGFAHSNFMQA